jgi:hypothetical protein
MTSFAGHPQAMLTEIYIEALLFKVWAPALCGRFLSLGPWPQIAACRLRV